jgi:hypothetical protein
VALLTEQDGQIISPGDKGIYFFDTRLISSRHIAANGVPWDLLNSGNIAHYASPHQRRDRHRERDSPRRSLGLSIGRSFGGGMHEDIDVTNYGPSVVRFNLEVAMRCDFADIFEVKSKRIVRRGKITLQWSATIDERICFLASGEWPPTAISVRRRLAPPDSMGLMI